MVLKVLLKIFWINFQYYWNYFQNVFRANSDTKDSDGPGPSKKARVALDEFSPQYKAQNEKLTEALEHAKKMKKAELSSLLEVNGIAVPRKTGDIQVRR